MAEVIKNGVEVAPGSGSGNTQLTVKAVSANRGNREVQEATFVVTAPGVSPNKSFIARHLPAEEFVEFNDGEEMSVIKEGGNITINGTSNSKKLTFSKGTGDIITDDISAVEYTADGKNTVNGIAIEGDPGAEHKYAWSLKLKAQANTTLDSRTQQITVVCESTSVQKAITLNQTAGDPYLEIDPQTINVPQDGSEVQVQINTNTTFTVS